MKGDIGNVFYLLSKIPPKSKEYNSAQFKCNGGIKKMKTCILMIWGFLDPIYYMFTRLSYIEKCRDESCNIFRVRLIRYKGKEITLPNGKQLKKNDLLVKIHLHNIRLLSEMSDLKSEVKRVRFITNYVKNSLPGVVSYIDHHKRSDDIRGIIGVTTLNKGSKRLGFETFDIHNPIYKGCKTISSMTIGMLSSVTPYKSMRKQTPKYIFMSKDQLVKKYK